MKNIITLISRNSKLFLRDRATVFFSILSSLIIVLLYFLFIGQVYIDGINGVLPLSENASGFMVYSQMIVGILVINSMSLTLGMFLGAAKDFESRRVDNFMTTPLKRYELLISYLISAFAVSFILNFATWIFSVILIGLVTSYWLSIGAFFAVGGVLLLCSLISSCIMMLLTVAIRSSTALGVFNSIAGTFVGFISGIYMPYSQMGNGIKAIGSFLPYTHLTVWLKNIVLSDVFSQVKISNEMAEIILDKIFSAGNVGFATLDAPLWAMLIFSALVGFACLIGAALVVKKIFNKSKKA
ncbi:MAG: ABC transporter permease [Clostridia bacterium]